MNHRIVKSSCVLTGFGVGGVLLIAPISGCFTSTNASPHDAGFDSFALPDVAPGDDAAPGMDVAMGSCPTGWYQGAGGACFISLAGNWGASTDANTDGPDTVADLGSATTTSVSVVQSHANNSGQDCGCNSQHLMIPLGKTFSCATSTLAFDYATTTVTTATNTPALNVRFCTGPCATVDGGGGPSWYGGPQYEGSPAAPGSSNCAYAWKNDAGTSANYFPASAKIVAGQTNTVPLGSYMASTTSDQCTGTFDTIDVHVQVYNCFANETGTNTLSNLRIY